MVGKGSEAKSSRIFYQCYLKCCKLQNLTPLNNVIPSGNGKVLNFCVDRIKYTEWAPILNALSCDLSLHSVSIKCRQQVKTILEHVDCERLAKTVNKRAVILTNFMLSNFVEAIAQLLSNTTLLSCLLLEGLPLRIPYLNPLCEAFLTNGSLQHIYLPRCLVGDAGCLALCKAIRQLPNILTLDLSGCELTKLGASYLADLVKHQKIHRYSENWVQTLRYRLPELDTMAGLRRISLCGNPQLGDSGVGLLMEVLSDDLWIKALDIQNCGLTEQTAEAALRMLRSNTTLVILDLRNNGEITSESLSNVRTALREHEQGSAGQFIWLSSSGSSVSSGERCVKNVPSKNGVAKEKTSSKIASGKYTNKSNVFIKKEKEYAEDLEEQLQEEKSHRKQLEELNLQLVDQMRQLKQQQIRLWANSSASEQSFQASVRSGDLSSSTDSTSSVPIDQSTLSYIQQAFKDIYGFIKENQCYGQCLEEIPKKKSQEAISASENAKADSEDESEDEVVEQRVNIIPKKAHSAHMKLTETRKVNKITKSSHLLGKTRRDDDLRKPDIIERQMGDTRNTYIENQSILEDIIAAQMKSSNLSCSSGSGRLYAGSSDTLVCSPPPNPREALVSSDDDDEDDDEEDDDT